MLVSVTDLASYLYCPRSLFMQRVMGRVEPPNQAMIMGLLKHAVFEQASINEKRAFLETKEGQTKETFQIIFQECFSHALDDQLQKKISLMQQFNILPERVASQVLPSLLSEAKSRAETAFSFATCNNLYGYELWESIIPKIFSETRVVSKDLNLQGRIDKIELYKDRAIVHELKTGKPPNTGVWSSHRIQASAYCMLAERTFCVPVKEAIVTYNLTGEQRTLSLNPFMEKEVTDTTSKVIALMESREAPEPCNKTTCSCKPS